MFFIIKLKCQLIFFIDKVQTSYHQRKNSTLIIVFSKLNAFGSIDIFSILLIDERSALTKIKKSIEAKIAQSYIVKWVLLLLLLLIWEEKVKDKRWNGILKQF